jgi:tetratricopeptide (TPR) repeat protein
MTLETERRAEGELLTRLLRTHHERGTGSLEVEAGGRTRRIHLAAGEIWLSSESPLAGAVRELGSSGDAARWSPLLDRLVEAYLAAGAVRGMAWRAGESPPADAAGPLPTEALLRRAFAARGRDAEPPGQLVVASESDRDGAGAPACWSPEERWVLERLRRPMRFDALRAECPFPEAHLRAALAGLVAVGRLHDPQRAPTAPQDSGLLRLVELLSARVAASLRDRPLGLLDDAHRRRVEALARGAEGKTHYELLGVPADASAEAIQAAFEGLARLLHPVHAERGTLGLSAPSLMRLFERAVGAYRTLGDPALRAAYDASHGVERAPAGESGGERRAELEELARREFDRARFEELNGDLHSALVLYEQVVELSPSVDHLLALARLQAKNPAWNSRALATVQRALELAPQEPALLFLAGELFERAGQAERAAGYFQACVGRAPEHAGAQAALRRLAARGVGAAAGESRGLGKLFRRG